MSQLRYARCDEKAKSAVLRERFLIEDSSGKARRLTLSMFISFARDSIGIGEIQGARANNRFSKLPLR